MVSEDDERVSWHSDTLVADQAESPYVEGAAVLVVMKGMRQMLFTRGLKGGTTQKVYDFPSLGVPAVELTDGSAYVLPAGKAGSVDWLVEHCTRPHPDGPGTEWEEVGKRKRMAWIFRAIKPSHAQWYANQAPPYRMLPPSHARKLYGSGTRSASDVWS
jgi:hypothetical protein